MKARKLKKGADYEKSVMYWFDFSRDIMVEERQDNSGTDRAILHYVLEDGDRAYFSKEYLPRGMSKEGVKKPDITAIVERANERKAKWYIYELKDTVMYAKTAMQLCSQWHSGIQHLESQYLCELDGYMIEDSLGVISRYWSREKLQEEKSLYEAKLITADRDSLLTARKSQTEQNRYRQKVRAIQFILDGLFVYDNEMGRRKSYVIHHIQMDKVAPDIYSAELNIDF